MASQQPPFDERELRKQQIRPRFIDLAEFDDDVPEDSSSRRAALDSFSNWPPAATVVRKKPPPIASSSKSAASVSEASRASGTAKKTTVESIEEKAASSAATVGRKTPQASEQVPSGSRSKSVRFDAQTKDESDQEADAPAPPRPALNLAGSIIGSISERSAGQNRPKAEGSTRSKPSGSRFVVRRRMDEDLQKHEEQRRQRQREEATPDGQEPGTGFPVVSHRDQIAPILPPTSGKSRALQYSEDIETVEAPQRDSLAFRTALSEHTKTSPSHSLIDASSKTQPAADDEEWLDEDGRPMSAFRKSRLLRQGLRPPSVRPKSSLATDTSTIAQKPRSFVPDPTRDPGGGADIDAITAVLSDVSRENDQKLRQMSAAEVSEELHSLESLFGKDVLERLRNRKGAIASHEAEPKTTSAIPTQPQRVSDDVTNASAGEEDKDGPVAIKRQYFPAEPEGPNPSLEWMMPQHSTKAASTDLRFDFSGKVIRRDLKNDETYLSGLHHHGDDQQAPGYTFAELIHLSRSTVAAQRQLALNVLGRICEHHPAFGGSDDAGSIAAVSLLNEHAMLLRARVITMSRWFLDDRHFTVRAAALRCLTSAIRALPSGISLPLGAGQELDFGPLLGAADADADNKDADAEASEVEEAMQKDWANVVLESNIVSLFLNKTDSVITSTWEAELALELLYRIASCSADHAKKVFEDDPKKLGDFIIHLGLNIAWPPVQAEASLPGTSTQRSSTMPSLTAVRLLHQVTLSDREIAKALVASGSVEHLLRFVVTFPWKIEQDWLSDDDEAGDEVAAMAYQIFDEILHLFVSLASYGFFASIVARTWNLWQESSTWALQELMGKPVTTAQASSRSWINEARTTAAQRIFELLAAWTHCAMDPHELMTVHDITWTQVRDWVQAINDAAADTSLSASRGSTSASALGALCAYVDAWLRCSIAKEPRLLEKHLAPCKAVISQSSLAIRSHFLEVLRLFSTAPTQAVGLDEAQQACLACHRYLDATKTILRADQALSDSASPESTRLAANNSPMLQEVLALVSCSSVWQALQSAESRASGRHVYSQTFSDFVAAVLIAQPDSESRSALELAAITRLDARHASRVADIVLRLTVSLADASVARILRPFLLECVLGSNHLPEKTASETVGHRDTTPLSQVTSLFKAGSLDRSAQLSQPASDEADEDEEDEDIDPITGSKLWKCPANGLPIRPDWPLLTLDDLLHSANTAVFNRPNNLDEDWKPSELEMVQASLQQAVAVFRNLLASSKQFQFRADVETAKALNDTAMKAMLSRLPSPEQILLGVTKVFMLEKDQADTFTDKTAAGASQQKQTGSLTGRDLFRDSTISSQLTSLLDIVDELIELRQSHSGVMSTVTLDMWTTSTYGSGVSFYQFFTDLAGLWDSISFGDANFARVVMTIANAGRQGGVLEGEEGMAVDFRRLVWNDYSDSLRSMPPAKVPDWVLGWNDTDADMLQHYCRYLVSAAETKGARGSMAWQIAKHHVGAALRALDRKEVDTSKTGGASYGKRVEGIFKSLYLAKGEGLLKELLEPPTAASADRRLSAEEFQSLVARLSS